MTFSARLSADRLCRALDTMDLSHSRAASGLSGSQYVELEGYKIRFSDHAARPTYEALNGAANCEIGSHEMAASEDWKYALAFICRRLDRQAPARHNAAVAAIQSDMAERAARRAYMASPEYKADCAAAIMARLASPEHQARVAREALDQRIEAMAREMCAADGHDFRQPKSHGRARRNKYRELARATVSVEA